MTGGATGSGGPDATPGGERGIASGRAAGSRPDIFDAPTFYLGVFFTFAPVILLFTLAGRQDAPWWSVLFWFVVSGLVGLGWALLGGGHRRVLLPAIALQVVSIALVAGVIDTPLALRGSGVSLMGIGSVGLIAVGYVCFVRFIRSEGIRALRLATEMDLAASIHRHLAPPVRVRTPFAEAAGRSLPSGAMGGDLVEASLLADGSLEVVLADVSGHGVRAGVIMAMVKATLHGRRSRARTPNVQGAAPGPLADGGPEETLAELNRVLVELTQPADFATAAIVRIRPDGRAECALAGHPPALLRRGDGVREVGSGGLPLGIDADELYVAESIVLQRGDVLLLYSDGLTETEVGPGVLLGADALATIVGELAPDAPRGAAGCVDEIVERVAARAWGDPAADDRSAIVVRMLGER